MADPRVRERLKEMQIHRPEVDLAQPRWSSHGQYWCNLHVMLVHDARYMEIHPDVLQEIRDTIIKSAQSNGHLLSRAAIVPDHIHLTLGCHLEESPESVALSYMNNLADAQRRKPVFRNRSPRRNPAWI